MIIQFQRTLLTEIFIYSLDVSGIKVGRCGTRIHPDSQDRDPVFHMFYVSDRFYKAAVLINA